MFFLTKRWACLRMPAILAALAASACTDANPGDATPSVGSAATRGSAASASTNLGVAVKRPGFVGAFFRPEGPPPFGIYAQAPGLPVPAPYPTNTTPLVGPNSYCDGKAANGSSIDAVNPVDQNKLANLIYLGVRWTRMPAPQFLDDTSHTFGPGQFSFANFDSAQCMSVAYHNIEPVIGLEAGPVLYGSVFRQTTYPTYQSPNDFASWCGAVAAHEKATFPTVHRFSLPGNEVNANPQLFPGGEQQIASYAKACYGAIKSAFPSSYVYGFELNMDGNLNPAQFVRDMVDLGCKIGTCYDGIAMHLSLRYPVPAAGTPCYPNAGGDYGMQCIADIRNAAQSPTMHVLISESVYPVPSYVPDEATKAKAVTAEFTALSTDPYVDGVSYANIDECGLYSGYFAGGCIVDQQGNRLPGYYALQSIAGQYFD
jgi:hypothetical protein